MRAPSLSESEIEATLGSADLQTATMILLFGYGQGEILREVLSRKLLRSGVIGVIDFDLSVRAKLDHPQVSPIIAPDIQGIQAELYNFFMHQTIWDRQIRILGAPSVIEKDPRFWHEIFLVIPKIRDQVVRSFGDSISDSFLGFENSIDNLERSLSNSGISRLENKFRGHACISVASGPSLSAEKIEFLKSAVGRIPIIVCDSALRYLMAHQVFPDFVTAIERGSEVTNCFRDVEINERSHLIAPVILLEGSLKAFKGESLLYSPFGHFCETLSLYYLGKIMPGHSAGNLNLASALYFGFSKIILIGHDLAFHPESLATHFEGIGDARGQGRALTSLQEKAVSRPSQDGASEVLTNEDYDFFRLEIETLIAMAPECAFINTSAFGAKIEGCEYSSLKEAMENIPELDAALVKREFLTPTSRGENKSRRLLAKANVAGAIHSIEDALKELHSLSSRLQKEGESEEDLVHAIFSFKKKWLVDTEVFKRAALSVLLPAHLIFERHLNEFIALSKSEDSLNREFIRRHQDYFKIFFAYLPQILGHYQRAAKFLSREDMIS